MALNGHVKYETISALIRARAAGLRLILITGRELPDLLRVFHQIDLFDLLVVENGAVLFWPSTRIEKSLCSTPAEAFVAALQRHQVSPLSVGRCVVATLRPFEATVQEVINEMQLDWQIALNRESVMVLPAGVNKATGLKAALAELGIVAAAVVGIGDAENDAPFLAECGLAVAVANAIDSLKDQADLVTQAPGGDGVVECITNLLASDAIAPVPLPPEDNARTRVG